ncbi:hypothetical protein ABZS94_35325 [Streptomyces sp. NPDC005500]|uniref:hypothetical protein n=1 Tax=Streptomyces sp. NPDC005500 TaxID=3155007 RepID=UPI0033ADD300
MATELPLMTEVVDRFRHEQPLADTAVMVTGHFLTDLAHLVECLAALGAPLNNMTVLQKDYAYQWRHRIHGHLRDRGVHVLPVSDVRTALIQHTERARIAGLRCVGLDDGGYLTPELTGELRKLASQWAGVVEQTMSGIYKLEGLEDNIPFPVFSVAQSRLKGRIESYWIADKAVSTALSLLPPVKVEGQTALVIGYGNVGEQVTKALTARRMRVAVHDADILRLIDAHENGHVTARNINRLLDDHRPLLVFGATGRTSMAGDQFRRLRRDCFLASVTSRDTEFDLTALDALAIGERVVSRGARSFRLPNGTVVTVLAGGRPVNFYETDSISNLHSDLVYAGILIGARALAEPQVPGISPQWADQVLESSGLLEDYYHLYGPEAEADRRSSPFKSARNEL